MKKFFEKKSRAKGFLLTLGVAILSMALWVLIYRRGYVAAVVSFATAFGVFTVFKLGAGEITKKDVIWLSLIILAITLLSFYVAFVFEIWDQYNGLLGGEGGFFSADFWSTVGAELVSITEYSRDLLMSLGFAVLGAGSLFLDRRQQIKTDS